MTLRRLRSLRFSLRFALVLVTLLCAWLGWWTYTARRQAAAVAVIESLGGEIRYRTSPTRLVAPTWLVRKLGPHYFTSAQTIVFRGYRNRPNAPHSGDKLEELVQAVLRLPRARCLVCDSYYVQAKELACLSALSGQLEESHFRRNVVHDPLTDEDIDFLRNFAQLRELEIDPKGLLPSLSLLPELRGLKSIDFAYCNLTAEHFRLFSRCKNLEELSGMYVGFRVCDFQVLENLPKLSRLNFQFAKFQDMPGDSAEAALEKMFPGVDVSID